MGKCKHCKFWKRNKIYQVTYEITDWRDNKTKYTHTILKRTPDTVYTLLDAKEIQ